MRLTPYLDEIERELAAFGRRLRAAAGCEPIEVIPPRIERFDGAAAWSRLTSEQQGAIGAAALEVAVAREGMEVSRDTREELLFEAAENAAGGALAERALEPLLEAGAIPRDAAPGIPSLLGPICRGCGRTARDADRTPPWESASEWPEPDRCPACVADAPVQARTTLVPEAPVMSHDEPIEAWCEPCHGTGEVECYCGGDLCVCGEQTTECHH